MSIAAWRIQAWIKSKYVCGEEKKLENIEG